jgi:UDP-N-acetylmuramate dehydrogenase
MAVPITNYQLPVTRGSLRRDAAIGRNTWFQVGGPAQYLFKPEDAEDLADFLRQLPPDMPLTVIGVGSNLLVRDGGVEGVVVRLGRGFTALQVASCKLQVGAGCLDLHAAQFACEHGLAGLEFLSGIPGTIGGAVAMNGGAYGSDMAQVLERVEIVDAGGIRWLTADELRMAYRHATLPPRAIVTRTVLKGQAGTKEDIARRMAEIQSQREATQPIRSKTGGSTFKNPPGHKAWELINAAGCRGLTLGGAMVSGKHCNFLINTGGATAADLENLGEEVRRRVHEHSGVTLEWEIKRIGRALTSA